MLIFRAMFFLSAFLVVACDKNAPKAPREAPRPVEAYVLREIDPSRPQAIAGPVVSWKEQDVAFEVNGTVRFVEEPRVPPVPGASRSGSPAADRNDFQLSGSGSSLQIKLTNGIEVWVRMS